MFSNFKMWEERVWVAIFKQSLPMWHEQKHSVNGCIMKFRYPTWGTRGRETAGSRTAACISWWFLHSSPLCQLGIHNILDPTKHQSVCSNHISSHFSMFTTIRSNFQRRKQESTNKQSSYCKKDVSAINVCVFYKNFSHLWTLLTFRKYFNLHRGALLLHLLKVIGLNSTCIYSIDDLTVHCMDKRRLFCATNLQPKSFPMSLMEGIESLLHTYLCWPSWGSSGQDIWSHKWCRRVQSDITSLQPFIVPEVTHSQPLLGVNCE